MQIETLNGVVQLSGFVKSAAEKAEAERIARETKGVKDVKNNLLIRQ
ncbi:BON domain-containing protein [Acinetobacter baumannii]